MKLPPIDPETEFLSGLIELQYGQDVIKKLTALSGKVSWAQHWPEDKIAFWNAEAFMWSHKITAQKRQLIQQELQILCAGKNLDLGCGAYSYVPSVGFDLSPKMLLLNEQCTEKIQGDVEKPLPFPDQSFDSVTAIFLLNYIQNYQQLLSEIYRVLKPKGKFITVLSTKKINKWQRQKQVHNFTKEQWKKKLSWGFFSVTHYEKENLLFFQCTKA